MNGACTIVSPNYLAYARTVSASYLKQHPEHRFFILIVADLSLEDRKVFEGEEFTPVMLMEIGLTDVRGEAMKYDILELNTNVKPTFMKYLIQTFDLERLIYLDPDIFVYSPLTPVFEALDGGAVAVLTPHMTTPVEDDRFPGEQEMLYNGTYNLGFIAVRRCEEAWRLLSWWERRCLDLGFSEGRTGLFVDQKWMNLAPGMFDQVKILRHLGCNMAYWNLQERTLVEDAGNYVVNGLARLCFFHFSGIVPDDPAMLSKNTNRYTLADRPDLGRLFREYKSAVLANKDGVREGMAYGFDRMSDGTVITRLARRIYAKHQARWAGQDPFDATGDFAAFAKKLGLVTGKAAPGKATWKEFDPKDRRVAMVHLLLKIALRILGPNRYELLMRYLSHIAVLRNQSIFLKD
ncbi:MAG TPA: hypothetical protein VMU57_21650 [Edaphobacter sp.]|uniref:group 1 glycosyl transferase n=1 Tax=Edaphobacter sp. TaxID=1934404 RepID=UPI002B91BF45|nr:group 1 glycosyl transferase [Edaphobacter sp.]HUZ97518.1 hypothetical protein [Edaphobacter sp.]